MQLLQIDTHRGILLVLIVAVVCAVCAVSATADQFTLKDGKVLEGTVIAEMDKRYYVKVVRDGKTSNVFVDKANVAKITRGKIDPQVPTTLGRPTTPPPPRLLRARRWR